jgi:hypothetical protein
MKFLTPSIGVCYFCCTMKNMIKKIGLVLLLCVCYSYSNAQKAYDYSRIDSLSLDSLHDVEIRLADLGKLMITSRDENERITSSYNFVKAFIKALKIENSYFYNFDTIKNISVLISPDNRFKVITWNLALNNQTYRNYGVIQLNPDYMKKIKDTTNLRSFYPLIDKSDKYKIHMDTTVTNENWLGALYYKILPVTHNKKTYYTLLGWDGHTAMSNKKIVESLYFENNIPMFGAPIYDIKDKRYKRPLKRLIFEYNNDANMLIRYEPSKSALVIENVAPTRSQDYGHPETYVPDGSYDWYKFNKKLGVWEKQPTFFTDFGMQK